MVKKAFATMFCLALFGHFTLPGRADSAELYEKVGKEGKVVLYSCPGREYVEPLVKELERIYPGIKIETTYGKGSQLEEKIRSEARAGRPVADLFSCGWNSLHRFGAEGYLGQYVSPELKHFPASAVDKSGMKLPHSAHVYGIVINTRMVGVEDVRSWADLANPKWKGKLAVQDPRRGGGFSWFVQTLMDPALGESYVRKMGQQKIFFGRTNDLVQSMLVRGEYAIHIAGTEERAAQEAEKGAPLKFIKPRDGAFYTRIGFSMVKNAPHPNATKLYIDFVLSEKGQKLLGETGYVAVRKGIRAKDGSVPLEGANLAYAQSDEGMEREPEFEKKLKEIFFP
jgi:iron(III) transport system substrate-binding protein